MPTIEIADFSFSIGRKVILKDVSLTVRDGEYLAIIGPNGAGKTTLLKCIDRIYTGGTGTIKVDGRPLGRYSQRELAKLISYVPQTEGRLFPFTVHEFVMMGRYPHLSPFSAVTREDEAVVAEALTLTGTTEFAERHLDTLSGGERQKVFIAAALAQGAKILLLDEPTTFLDYKHRDEVNHLLRRLNRRSGVTVVAVMHDINIAAMSSDRVIALKEGSVVFRGDAKEVMHNDVLEQIYGKTFLFVEHPETARPIVVPEEIAE